MTSPPPGARPSDGAGGAGPEFPTGPEVPIRQQPEPPRKTSGFAIASLVFGIIGGILFSVIFGIVALRRIRTRNLKGRGLAIAGLVLSGLWTLLIAVGVIIAVATDAERDPSGRVREAGTESVFDLRVGDCINNLEETTMEVSVDVVPCSQPHDAELISSFEFPGGDYPGEESIFRVADRRCSRELDAVAGAQGFEPFYFYPTEQSWATGDRQVNCVALFSQPRRGSVLSP
jgi:uncharacterized protein DUF4190/putative regulator of septum formation